MCAGVSACGPLSLPPFYHPTSLPLSPLQPPLFPPSPMQASLFSQSWASQGRAVVERLRGRTFFPTQLDGINWRLNLSMAQASQSKMKLPNAQFECQWYKDRRGDSWPIMQCAYYCLLLADTSVNNAKFSRENIFANLQVLAQTVIFA